MGQLVRLVSLGLDTLARPNRWKNLAETVKINRSQAREAFAPRLRAWRPLRAGATCLPSALYDAN